MSSSPASRASTAVTRRLRTRTFPRSTPPRWPGGWEATRLYPCPRSLQRVSRRFRRIPPQRRNHTRRGNGRNGRFRAFDSTGGRPGAGDRGFGNLGGIMSGVKKPKPVPRCPVFLLRCPACNWNNFTQQEVDEGYMLLECQICKAVVKLEWVER